jgi:hypothetical protein
MKVNDSRLPAFRDDFPSGSVTEQEKNLPWEQRKREAL